MKLTKDIINKLTGNLYYLRVINSFEDYVHIKMNDLIEKVASEA